MKRMLMVAVGAAAVFGMGTPAGWAQRTNRYVVKDNVNAAPPYDSWANAAANIQTAIDYGYTAAGSTVLVAAAVYDSGGTVAAGRLLSPQTLAQATQLRISGVDEVLGVPARWASGFLLNTDGLYGPSEAAFGHSGWGGSFAMVDPDRKVALSYTMNRMGTDLVGDPRDVALIAAAYEGLAATA